MKKSTLIILLTALISFFLPSFALPDITQQSVRTSSIPLPFIENQGQLNSQALYYGPTQAGTLFITRSGKHIFSLPKPESKSVLVIHEEFVGSKNTTPIGLVPSKAQINRYIGNDPKAWQEKLTTWQKIGINELYPGINYQLRPFSQYAEKIFVVNPGADPNQIQLEVKGVDELSIGKDGSLKLHSTIGELEYSPPIAYQEINEQRIPVEISYELKGNTYGFTIGVYDRKQPLVIDPLIRTTFFGGNDTESGYGIAVNQTSGSVYITGYTSSYDLPTTAGVFKEEKTDLQDIFVAKFDADLSTLEAATFYGSNGWEYGVAAIALHPDGSVYLTGKTQGTDLPGASSGYQSAYTGGTLGDVFVARLNEDLSGPPQATYFGGTGEEVGISITVNGYPGQDLYGSVYIAGRTSSVDLPGTSGGFLDTLQGTDVFVAYFDPTLQTLGQATYFGGTGWDEPASDARGQAMLIHPNTGSVLLVGNTGSNFIPSLSGDKIGTDGFYARLHAHLDDAQSGIFIGGNGEDLASAMAIMPIDGSPDVDVFIVGRTKSTEGLVDPAQVGYQTSYQGGNFDAFVVRLNGYITTEITESTYLGGEADDRGYGITVNPSTGRVWVTGQTNSTGFPTSVNADQAAIAGADDAFTVSLSHDLSSLEYGSYLGGTTTDYGTALTVNASTGDVYLLGYTRSEDLYGTDTLSADDTHNGYGDAFIALFEEAQPPPLATWVIDDFAFTNSWGPDLAIDDSGNLYACYFRGNLFYTAKRDVSTGQWATLYEFEKPAGDPGFSDCSITVETNGGVHACMVTMPDKTNYQPTNDLWYIGPGAVGFEAVDADRSDLYGAEGQCDINLWNNMPSISYRIYYNVFEEPPYALAVAVKPAPDQSWIVMDNIRNNGLSPQEAYWSGEDNYGEATALAFDSAGLPLAVFTDEDGTASFYVPSFYPPFVPTALPTWTRYTSAHSGKPLHLDWLNALDFGGGNIIEDFSLIGNVSGTKTAISWVTVLKSNGSVDDVIAKGLADFILDTASSSGVSDGSLSRHLVASHNNQARYMALDSLYFPLLNPIFAEPIDNPIAHSTEIIGEGLENCALAKEIDGIAHALCEDDTGNIVYARQEFPTAGFLSVSPLIWSFGKYDWQYTGATAVDLDKRNWRAFYLKNLGGNPLTIRDVRIESDDPTPWGLDLTCDSNFAIDMVLNPGETAAVCVRPDEAAYIESHIYAYLFVETDEQIVISELSASKLPDTDEDGDGVPDINEYGPDGNDPDFDGNDDGIPDSEQSNVASFSTTETTENFDSAYITIAIDEGKLANVKSAEPLLSSILATTVHWIPPWGYWSFEVHGVTDSVIVSITLHRSIFDIYEPTPSKYSKYGPTTLGGPDEAYYFLYDGTTGAQIDGNVVTLTFVDGERGDNDLIVNNTIIDPGGPTVPLVDILEEIKQDVLTANLPAQLERSLIRQLNTAISAIESGRKNAVARVTRTLTRFITLVEADAGTAIPQNKADVWINIVQGIISLLNPPAPVSG